MWLCELKIPAFLMCLMCGYFQPCLWEEPLHTSLPYSWTWAGTKTWQRRSVHTHWARGLGLHRALWNRTPVPACLLCWSLVSSLGPGPLHLQDSGDQCHTPPGVPCRLLLPFKMPCSRAHSGALSPQQIGTYIFIFQMSLKKFSKRR